MYRVKVRPVKCEMMIRRLEEKQAGRAANIPRRCFNLQRNHQAEMMTDEAAPQRPISGEFWTCRLSQVLLSRWHTIDSVWANKPSMAWIQLEPIVCLLSNTKAGLAAQSFLPLKDRKILGAERGSLEGGGPPDDEGSRASSQHSLSHNMSPC